MPHKPLKQFLAESSNRYCHQCFQQMKQRLSLMEGRERQVAARLRRVYRLTLKDYGRIFDSQRGVCAICRDRGVPLQHYDPATGLVVDHDHDTGVVRGLLCARCNSGIGLLGDDPRNLDAAAAYLRQTKGA